MSRRGPLRPLSVAPMMDYTDRHYRYFMRCITKHTLLTTEMVHARAVLHGDRERLIGFSPQEKPLALQVGGHDPKQLAAVAQIAQDWGYDEIDLNVGCPSPRVTRGAFGACLMATPQLVADCVRAMRDACSIPVTVKHRIGIDDRDHYDDLLGFVDVVSESAPDRLIIHARKAWLTGLSPKQNRTVPPLRYHDVYRIKRERPHLAIEINGGITTLDQATLHLNHVDGVMIGRAAIHTPFELAKADSRLYTDAATPPSREQVAQAMIPYIERCIPLNGFKLLHVVRHLFALYAGQPGAKAWRRALAAGTQTPGAGPEVLVRALQARQQAIEPAIQVG